VLRQWINNNYGSRRGIYETYKHQFFYKVGLFDKYENIDLQKIERLIFVCKGNICRSAFAEAVARNQDFETASCGINTTNGNPANEIAAQVALSKGYDLSRHETRTIFSLELRRGDLLVAMEPGQAKFIEKNVNPDSNCSLLGLWGHPATPYVHDPFGASMEYYQNCFAYIESCVHSIVENIAQAKNSSKILSRERSPRAE